jgi:predicted N-acetyltransferase YhbS
MKDVNLFGVKIVNIQPEHAPHLEQLQRDCFPTLGENELMRAEHFRNHAKLFPEGNFVAQTKDHVVGLGSGFLIDFDFDHADHTFQDIIDGGFYTHHDPDGDYYYGADISVHPKWRRRGIGRRLYRARKEVVRRLNRKGIVAGGLIPDYAKHKHKLSPQDYVQKVVAHKLHDSTLSFQLSQGFKVRGLLENYIEDEASDNWSTLIVWENPDYK